MQENNQHKKAAAQENYEFAQTIQKTMDRLLDSKIKNVWTKLSLVCLLFVCTVYRDNLDLSVLEFTDAGLER